MPRISRIPVSWGFNSSVRRKFLLLYYKILVWLHQGSVHGLSNTIERNAKQKEHTFFSNIILQPSICSSTQPEDQRQKRDEQTLLAE